MSKTASAFTLRATFSFPDSNVTASRVSCQTTNSFVCAATALVNGSVFMAMTKDNGVTWSGAYVDVPGGLDQYEFAVRNETELLLAGLDGGNLTFYSGSGVNGTWPAVASLALPAGASAVYALALAHARDGTWCAGYAAVTGGSTSILAVIVSQQDDTTLYPKTVATVATADYVHPHFSYITAARRFQAAWYDPAAQQVMQAEAVFPPATTSSFIVAPVIAAVLPAAPPPSVEPPRSPHLCSTAAGNVRAVFFYDLSCGCLRVARGIPYGTILPLDPLRRCAVSAGQLVNCIPL